METREKYKTNTEKDNLIVAHSDKILLEVQDHEDGKFLIFGDVPRPLSDKSRLKALEDRVATLEQTKVVTP